MSKAIYDGSKFEVWGSDDCKNYDKCSGRITLFVANKECISCNPESYERKPDEISDTRRLEWMIKNEAKVSFYKRDIYWCEIIGNAKMRAYDGKTPREAIDAAMKERE